MLILVGLILGFPLLLSLFLFLKRDLKEKTVSKLAHIVGILHTLLSVGLILNWWTLSGKPLELRWGALYEQGNYHFPILFYIDRVGLVFLFLTSVLSGLVMHYSNRYLHKEVGYRSFFARILLFEAGLSLLSLAGTLDIFFAGWEIVGLSSFLLIAFYHDRLQPVRNAVRVFSIYRLCDVGLLLTAWLSHLVWHGVVSFSFIGSTELRTFLQQTSAPAMCAISLLLVLAASGKSAQFPFSYWVARAMEGPTPSSAIFYGALSIHAGVLLLIRTEGIWRTVPNVQVAVGIVGLLTAVISTLCGRVQSNVKARIAYASSAQVGLQFFEVAMGWDTLALYHLVANSLVRCYQLLASSSVMVFQLRELSAKEVSAISPSTSGPAWLRKLRSSLYVFALNEGYLEDLLRVILWGPLHRLALLFSNRRKFWVTLGFPVLLGLSVYSEWIFNSQEFAPNVPPALLILGLSLLAFSEVGNATFTWNCVVLSSLSTMVLVGVVAPDSVSSLWVYGVGVAGSWLLGYLSLRAFQRIHSSLSLNSYSALWHYMPRTSGVLLFAVAGLAGFPNTPAFVGEDVLLNYLVLNHLWLAVVLSISFILNGVTLIRLYSHLCFGRPGWVVLQSRPT